MRRPSGEYGPFRVNKNCPKEGLAVRGTHAIMLLSLAPRLAAMFRIDPKIADLLDPAIYIAADGDGVIASVVERLELIDLLPGFQSRDLKPIWDKFPEEAPIAVLVTDSGDAGSTGSPIQDPSPIDGRGWGLRKMKTDVQYSLPPPPAQDSF
jgi:hypothetical protein